MAAGQGAVSEAIATALPPAKQPGRMGNLLLRSDVLTNRYAVRRIRPCGPRLLELATIVEGPGAGAGPPGSPEALHDDDVLN